MGHQLKPHTGSLPPAREIARRLAIEFAYVKADEAEAIKEANARADWIERAPSRIFFGRHQEALNGAARLRKLMPGEALVIYFGDEQANSTRISVIPGEPINFGYGSGEEEARLKSLVERCARALDCDVVLF